MNNTSAFLSHLHHAYAQTDGTYAFPNSREGDMLKQGKREIDALLASHNRLRVALEAASTTLELCLDCGDFDRNKKFKSQVEADVTGAISALAAIPAEFRGGETK